MKPRAAEQVKQSSFAGPEQLSHVEWQKVQVFVKLSANVFPGHFPASTHTPVWLFRNHPSKQLAHELGFGQKAHPSEHDIHAPPA